MCDEICQFRAGRTQEELDAICEKCKLESWARAFAQAGTQEPKARYHLGKPGPSPAQEEAPEPEFTERTTFENLSGGLKNDPIVRKVYSLGLALADAEERPTNDCRVYLNIFNMARELDDALDNVKPDGAPALALRGALRDRLAELREMYFENYAVKKFKEGMQP